MWSTVFIPITDIPTTPTANSTTAPSPPDLTTTLTGGRELDTDTEKTLGRLFREVLGLADDTTLTAGDHFFRLGGHSLTATRVAARINTELGTSLTLREVFTTPTITDLATLIDTTLDIDDATAPSRVRITDIALTDPIPASYGQQALWVIDQLGGPATQYVVPTIWSLTGNLDTTAFTAAISDLVTRHQPLRTLLVEHDGTLTQHIVEPAHVAERLSIQVVDMRHSTPAHIDTALDTLIGTRFDLAADLPLRVAVYRTADDRWTIALIAHHHAIDEWSTPALIADRRRLPPRTTGRNHHYRSPSTPSTPSTTPPSIPPPDFGHPATTAATLTNSTRSDVHPSTTSP
ncbi:condensation domain-containing protein [Rhodococcus sp. P1Y]|uniref:condensation domain-containing protein n=1 Tax=Rhodococcus sp. P1Y TaxID=1302308 RepID=UPI0013797124|nr:condensation domain-containing protein [Rhodococcus sp. P1Y]